VRESKTQYYAASSLDGFIAAPDHSLDWLLQFGSPENLGYNDFIREVGAAVMGSATYEWLLRHHVQPEGGPSQPWPYEQPVVVFTKRQLPVVAGADVRFVQGDVRPVHQEMMKLASGKNVWLVGGGDLVGQFYDAGLLDELIIQIASVTLGDGSPLLPRSIVNPRLKLAAVKQFGDAFVELRYAVPQRT
jgi:dihydrofolate reductase